ncbi:MAG: signal peptidase I [Bacteroidia bacterium]|nr:signal peptidase I [Bacteroidia bacterium]
MSQTKDFNLKSTFDFYYKSPKQFTKKQWMIIALWCFGNLLIMFFYLNAGASVGIALLNFIYGCSLIWLYFTRILAFIVSPVIYAVLYILSLVRIVDKPGNDMVYEWGDALWFATLAATVIRSYFIEAYTIPTSSMEKSLLVGDFLFVSKFHYGTRLPVTPLSFPFSHNILPLTDSTPSFLTWMQMPYKRLPSLQHIKNNDVVVFNYPFEDGKPFDKKENYIKRCLAIAGDSIQVIEGQVYINGHLADNPENMQYKYYVKFDDTGYWNDKKFQAMLRSYDITEGEPLPHGNLDFGLYLTYKNKLKMEQQAGVIKVDSMFSDYGTYQEYIFPHNPFYKWSVDFFGPLYVPKAGDAVMLNPNIYSIYERAIRVYENNPDFKMQDDKFYLDGKEITSYTFKYNYYFMMGDNRHNSLDGRFWGFVPETNIVGKALFVWMSWDKNAPKFWQRVRWNRVFTGIH